MDFLKKELTELRRLGLYRRLRTLQGPQLPVSLIDGRQVINLASNNYLGLANHPKLRSAAKKAIDRFGVGTAAVRSIIGTQTIHNELENRIAKFKGVPAAVVLQSGFVTNAGTVQCLLTDEKDLLISDELNHASIIDGARLAKGAKFIYPHKDMAALRNILEKNARGTRRRLIVTDGVFSMDGDVAPLPEIQDLAERYDAMVMVDDAHASGVMGPQGRGTPAHFGLTRRVAIQIGTLSKAVASVGGYVAGSRSLQDYLYHKARPFLFSSSHPASAAASCLAALDILENEPERLARLWRNTAYFKEELRKLGFNTGMSETPITPVIVRVSAQARRLEEGLFREGVFALSMTYPTVPKGKERVRTIVTSEHKFRDLERASSAFAKVGRRIGII